MLMWKHNITQTVSYKITLKIILLYKIDFFFFFFTLVKVKQEKSLYVIPLQVSLLTSLLMEETFLYPSGSAAPGPVPED